MKRDFGHMLEVMPEAILIFDPLSNKLAFANAELKRLTEKYGKKKEEEEEEHPLDDSQIDLVSPSPLMRRRSQNIRHR